MAKPSTSPSRIETHTVKTPRLGGTSSRTRRRPAIQSAWRRFAQFNGIGELIVCLSDLEIAVAKHGIAGRFRLVAGVPSFSSIPTAVALHGHRATLIDQLYGRVKPNPAQRSRGDR